MTDQARQQAASMRPNENSALSPEQQQKIQDALQRASDSMRQSAQQMQNGQGQQSQQSQQQASQQLQEAIDQAQQALQEAQENAGEQQATPEDLDRLEERQREIEEQTRRLMERLKDLSRQRGTEPLERASRAMARARQSFEEEDVQQGEQSAREAEKHLEEAEDELEQEEERYENLRQEEVLYRVKEKLEELRERTRVARDDLAVIHREREGRDRLPRRLRPKVAAVKQEADDIRVGNEEGRSILEEDSSPVFPWILQKNTEDLQRVVEELDARYPETGDFTQFLLADVVDRYDQLLNALDEQLRQQEEEPQQPEGEQQDPGQQDPGEQEKKLIPTMAELMLLKKLQEGMIEDINLFKADSIEELDDGAKAVRLRMLERLGHQQRDLYELFDKLLEAQGADVEALEEES